jgi:hypothetical protein
MGQRSDDQRDLHTVNADGSSLLQVDAHRDISGFDGDWGTHPVRP